MVGKAFSRSVPRRHISRKESSVDANDGRGGGIRTHDPLHPKQDEAVGQAGTAWHPDGSLRQNQQIAEESSHALAPLGTDSKTFGVRVAYDSLGSASGIPALLSVREVAAILKVCTATVYKVCGEGKLPFVRISGALRIRAADVEAYLQR